MSVASWFASSTSGASTWASTVYQVESDLTCTYDVISTETDDVTSYWGPPNDGPYNLWFELEPTIVTLDSVTEDSPEQSYGIRSSATNTTPTFSYDIVSTFGAISGSGEFPFGSAERDFTGIWDAFGPPVESDKTFTYDVVTYVEDFLTFIYDVANSATADSEQAYGLGGYVQLDGEFEYRVINSAERDCETGYDIREGVTQDAQVTYDVITIPYSADNDLVVVYNVQSGIESDLTTDYNVLTFTERALTDTYRITRDLEKDLTTSYNVNSPVTSDLTASYDVLGLQSVYSNVIYIYSVLGNQKSVPNVIGYNLPKATEVLEREGFGVGTTRNVA